MSDVPTTRLSDGLTIPQLGFGVFQVPPDEAEQVVATALRAGYRSLDTAAAYQNEAGVGRAIAASGLERDDVYVTTKLWNDDQGYDEALRAFDRSLGELGLAQVDLYLVHWPVPHAGRYVDTWRAFRKIKAEGRARSVGVSNFTEAHISRLADETGALPVLNQVELHPYLQQPELRAFHAEHGIATEAWGPLGQGGEVLQDPVITGLADEYGKTPAQVILRWHLQLGNVVIPKSATPERIEANLDVFDVELADDDMAAIADLDRGERLGPDPETFG